MLSEDLSESWLVDCVEDGVDEGVGMRQDDSKQEEISVHMSRRRPKSNAAQNVDRQPTQSE